MKRLFFLFAALAVLSATTACDDDDDSVRVPSGVESAFDERFPGATHVRWSDRNGFLVADFRDNGTETKAWFEKDGSWRMTEVDITYAQLPEAVRTAFEQSEYGTWRVEDVEKLMREGMETAYELEVEKADAECELLYSEQGVLLRATADTDGNGNNGHLVPTRYPQAITVFLNQRYPGALILEVEVERYGFDVDILYGNRHHELMFDGEGEWTSTRTDVRQSDVPAAVMAAVRASEYGSWKIDDVELVETPEGQWYEFELESPQDREAKLRVSTDGMIL